MTKPAPINPKEEETKEDLLRILNNLYDIGDTNYNPDVELNSIKTAYSDLSSEQEKQVKSVLESTLLEGEMEKAPLSRSILSKSTKIDLALKRVQGIIED